jgi:hypothetical protein
MLIWTGTATVTNGDATVDVDTGAALTAEVVAHGAMVVLDGLVYLADSLTDTSTLELTRVYAGTTGTVDMEIWPVSQDTTNLVNLAQIVARTQAQINILDKNSQGLFFYMKGVTGAADPGAGFIGFDDTDPTLVTEAYVDALDANGRAVSDLVALWEIGTVLVIRSLTTTAYRAYEIAGNAAHSGWGTLTLSYIGHDGVLADNEALGISWSRVGEGLSIDAIGTFSGRSTYNTAAAGFVYLSTNGNGSSNLTPSIYRKASATSGDWSAQFPFQGPQGDRGWSPVFAVVSDSARRVLRLVDYVGGEGIKPTSGINQYVSAGGLTGTIGSATDIRGPVGLSAYEVAVIAGFVGDEEAWLATLVGASAYQVAVAEGFVGDEAAWLESLNGQDGANGTDPGALFNWDDGTADADPGAGNMRADNVDLASATFLYVSKAGRTGDDLEAFLLGIGSSTNTIKGHITLTNSAETGQAIIRVISLTDATGYVKIGLQDSTHAGVATFTDAEPVSLQFSLAGNQGAADEISMASAINGSSEVTDPAVATKFAITDPDNGDLLSWISFENLGNAIKPRALVEAKSANYTVLAADLGRNLNVSASAANRTITLPPAATAGNGFDIGVRKSDSSANTVTIDADGSETINGLTTLVLRHQREAVRLVCDGTAWFVSVPAVAPVATGTTGQVLQVNSGGDGTRWADVIPTRGFLIGLEIANDLTNPDTHVLIREGICRDSLNTTTIEVTATRIKRLNAGFSVGDGNGMRSSVSLADGTWHIFAIGGPGMVGEAFAHNTTDPSAVLPSGYTVYRHIASIVRASSAIVKFFQDGDYFTLNVPATTNVAADPGTSAVNVTLSVPTGIQIVADLAAELYTLSTHGSSTTLGLVTSFDQTDTAPAGLVFDLRASAGSSSGSRNVSQIAKRVKTNTNGQVRFRVNNSDAGLSGSLVVRGWWLNRGRF